MSPSQAGVPCNLDPEQRVELDLIQEMRAKVHRRQMLVGAACVIVGIIVTVGTYSSARRGGSYIVAWGAILFGAVDFVRGFVGWCGNR